MKRFSASVLNKLQLVLLIFMEVEVNLSPYLPYRTQPLAAKKVNDNNLNAERFTNSSFTTFPK